MMKKMVMGVLIAGFLNGAYALDIAQDKVPEPKRTETHHYLTPKETYDFMTNDAANTLFIDIRTPYEVQFVGHTEMMDANIPYLTYDYSDWDDKTKEYKRSFNSAFVNQVEDALVKKAMGNNKDARIILMCRSGDRSARAVDLMAKAGYTNVWSQIEGFEGDKASSGDTKGKRTVNGWKNANLPWTYDLNKAKAYFLE
jgi:rhodanese-related sulfurtransferase